MDRPIPKQLALAAMGRAGVVVVHGSDDQLYALWLAGVPELTPEDWMVLPPLPTPEERERGRVKQAAESERLKAEHDKRQAERPTTPGVLGLVLEDVRRRVDVHEGRVEYHAPDCVHGKKPGHA